MHKGHFALDSAGPAAQTGIHSTRFLWTLEWDSVTGRGRISGVFMEEGSEGASVAGARRRRDARPRRRVVKIRLSEEEFEAVTAAARQEGLAFGAFGARALLAVARAESPVRAGTSRDALLALMQAARQLNKVGVNLNQAVAKLNATGQRPDDLMPIATYCARSMERIDEAAMELRKRSA